MVEKSAKEKLLSINGIDYNMKEKYFFDIVLNKEKLSNKKDIYVAHCTTLGISSEGVTTEEAIKNIKEAIQLYLEETPEKYEDLVSLESPPQSDLIFIY